MQINFSMKNQSHECGDGISVNCGCDSTFFDLSCYTTGSVIGNKGLELEDTNKTMLHAARKSAAKYQRPVR